MKSSNISNVGITNADVPKCKYPGLADKSDAHSVSVKGGANIKKQVPGMNKSIVPLTPDPQR